MYAAIAALDQLYRIGFEAAGPYIQIGKNSSHVLRKPLNSDSLAGEMTGEDQRNLRRFGIEASMKAGFAR